MESWKTHLPDGMGLSWFHLLDGSFMIPSGRWVFHDSICQYGSFMIPSVKMGLSWFHLSKSWKTHLTDGMGLSWFHLADGSFMIPSVRWVFHDSICQMGLSWFHLSGGSFMIPSVRWVFHDSICQMGLSWFHLSNHERPICKKESWKTNLPDGIMKDPSARWNHERPI